MANKGVYAADGSLRVTIAGGSAGGAITIGTTTITGGADKQVIFNDGGVAGSDAGFIYDKATDTATLGILLVSDDAYAAGWNGSLAVPTKNAVYDKIETLSSSLVIGSTAISGGTSTRVLFNDGGVVGEDAEFTYVKATDALTVGRGYFGFNAFIGNPSTGLLLMSTGLQFGTKGTFDSNGTDAQFRFYNNAATNILTLAVTGANLVGIGGATSSFPALKRSSTVLQARLADDSAFAPLQGVLRTDVDAITGLTAGVLSATTNASITITDASGQVYRIPCII